MRFRARTHFLPMTCYIWLERKARPPACVELCRLQPAGALRLVQSACKTQSALMAAGEPRVDQHASIVTSMPPHSADTASVQSAQAQPSVFDPLLTNQHVLQVKPDDVFGS